MNSKIGIISTAEPGATGNQDYTITGFGTPVAVMIIGSSNTSFDTKQADANTSIGFSDGTNSRATTAGYEDNVGTSDARRMAVDAVYVRNRPTAPQTVDAVAEFVSFITNGVRLNWTTVPPTVRKITVILFGGTGVTARVGDFTPSGSVGGTVAISSLPARPEVVFFISNDKTFDAVGAITNAVVGIGSFGIATNNNGSFKNASISISHDHFADTARAGTVIYNNRCCCNVDARTAQVNFAGEMTAQTSSSFTITTRVNNAIDEVGYLSLNLNGDSFDIVNQLFTNSVTTQTWPTGGGLAFAPKYAFVAGSINGAVNTFAQENCCMGVGVADSVSSAFALSSAIINDNLDTTAISNIDSNTRCLHVDNDGGTEEKIGTISAWNSDSVTLNVTTNDGSDAYGFMLLVGEPAATRVQDFACFFNHPDV